LGKKDTLLKNEAKFLSEKEVGVGVSKGMVGKGPPWGKITMRRPRTRRVRTKKKNIKGGAINGGKGGHSRKRLSLGLGRKSKKHFLNYSAGGGGRLERAVACPRKGSTEGKKENGESAEAHSVHNGCGV